MPTAVDTTTLQAALTELAGQVAAATASAPVPGDLGAARRRRLAGASWSGGSGSVRRRARSMLRHRLVTIRYIQVEKAASARKPARFRHACTNASWVASSASPGSPSIRRATR